MQEKYVKVGEKQIKGKGDGVIILFRRVLLKGIIFSVLFGAMVTFIQIINPRLELHNYPLEIRKAVVPKTKEEKKKFNILAIPMFIILIVYLLETITMAYSSHPTSYLILFLHSFIVIMMWNIFDLLIMDWYYYSKIFNNSRS